MKVLKYFKARCKKCLLYYEVNGSSNCMTGEKDIHAFCIYAVMPKYIQQKKFKQWELEEEVYSE